MYKEVDRLKKHPSLFVEYLKQLARSKGISVNIDEAPHEKAESTAKAATTNYRLEAIQKAPNITDTEYEELVTQKKMGKTTTEENFKVDRHFWQQYLVQDEPDPKLLVEFMYGNNPLNNLLSLIDIQNHHEEDNLRSAQLVERARTIDELLSRLGFSSVVDRGKIDKDTFMEKWRTRIVGEPEFQSERLNEIFNLTKNHTIRADMTASLILWWANVLLNPFGLVLWSFQDKHFRLDEKIDIRSLIKRKNKIGKFYMDKDELLKQEKPQADLFLDEYTGRVLIKKEHVG